MLQALIEEEEAAGRWLITRGVDEERCTMPLRLYDDDGELMYEGRLLDDDEGAARIEPDGVAAVHLPTRSRSR